MKIRNSLVAVLIVASSIPAFAQDGNRAKLDRLDAEMNHLNDCAKTGRYIFAGSMGALGVGFGIAALMAERSVSKREAAFGSALAFGVGTLVAVLPSHRERMAGRYLKLSAVTDEERVVKLAKGEAYLEEIGDSERLARYSGVALLSALGAGYLVAAAIVDPNDYPNRNIRTEYAVSGVIFAAVGIATAFLPSDGERAHRRYEEWKSGHAPVAAWNFGILPAPKGLMAGVSLAF